MNKIEHPATQVAAETAKKLVEETARANDERTSQLVAKGIREFFDEQQAQKRFIDAARIPFICDDIKSIKYDLKALSRLIYIGIGVLTTVSIIVPLAISLLTRSIK